MIPMRPTLRLIGSSLALSFLLLGSATSGSPKPASPHQGKNPSLDGARAALTEDESRLLIKEIPSVNIGETLSRWSFSESELSKLRQWSKLLTEQPDRADFLQEWVELTSKVKIRNPSLQAADVTHLIQMVMSAAYEEAHKDLDSLRDQTRFYKEMERQISENLADAERLRVLVRPQSNDPFASTLIRLPSYQRTLKKCEERPDSTPVLDCRETLIATTMELDDYVAVSTKQIQQSKAKAQKAEHELERKEQKRLQMLEALSVTAKSMYGGVPRRTQ